MHRAFVFCCLLPFLTVGCQSERDSSPTSKSETKQYGELSGKAKPSEPEQAVEPEPLPREIVQTWEKAGAEVGWMWHYLPEGILIFDTEKKPDAGVAELPAFCFQHWQAGVLPKLPPPAAPFGLFLGTGRVEDAGKITDAGLKELAGLKSLQSLALGGSLVTDAGLKELAGLKNLRTLYLDRTQVTDAGLKELARLKSLKYLHVGGTKVTDAGLKELRKMLPQCEILPKDGLNRLLD